jgi:hypothetical protein
MRRICLSVLTLMALFLLAGPASAGEQMAARLRGFEEVPAISSSGGAFFSATINETTGTINWTMTYGVTNGKITQSHIHFAQKGVNGGIFVFLCSNLGNGPTGTQTCPNAPATISGTWHASDIIGGAAAQGIQVGDFGPVLRALKTGTAYVKLHTDKYPGGEIRGQVVFSVTP